MCYQERVYMKLLVRTYKIHTVQFTNASGTLMPVRIEFIVD